MTRTEFRSQRGFSVLEMIIVAVIIGILVVFAVAQFGNASSVFETQNVARELKVNLERARFDSVKRRPATAADMARVVIIDENTISVSLDLDQNGVLETTETRTIDFAGRNDVKIVGAAVSYPVTMVFDWRGHVTATNSLGVEIDPLFIVCDQCTSFEDADNPTSYYIKLSPTGTVSMYDNGQSPPSVTDPTVSSVGTNTAIEPLVSTAPGAIDLTGVTGMPTPFPTVSPDPSPSPSESPSPTPTACSFNERPAVTGCVCEPPMTVNGSGRCK
ncbi:MAG TPA: type II secretion system protein [Aridibacter sp.]|nr:type II secretion system protein [Aridibacter sp.]